MKEDNIGYNIYKRYFVYKELRQKVVIVIWIAKVSIFSIKNTFDDEHLVQINLNILMISRLIYKVFYHRLIYIGLERILKTTKNVEIFINRAETLKHYYKHYAVLKSIYIISYIPLAPTICLFAKIYIDIIEYKPFSTNSYKYIVYILDRYFNY